MKLPDVAVFAPCLSARPLLSCHWSIVALFVCRCSARLSLVHCWSVTGLLESVLLSCRCPVAVLSLSCRWSVAGLSLVHYWSVSSSIARHWSVCSGQGRCPVVGLLLVCHLPVVGHGRSCVCSFVARCSPVAPPACPSLACLLVRCLSAVRSPVCLLEPWSLARRSSICCPSLLRLLES